MRGRVWSNILRPLLPTMSPAQAWTALSRIKLLNQGVLLLRIKYCSTRSMGGVRMWKGFTIQKDLWYSTAVEPQNTTLVHGTCKCHKMVHVGADNSTFAVPYDINIEVIQYKFLHLIAAPFRVLHELGKSGYRRKLRYQSCAVYKPKCLIKGNM